MPLRRGRRDDGGKKYRMREKLFAIGDDYWIEDEEGERAFKVDGKAMRIRKTLILEDPSGAELFKGRPQSARIGQIVATGPADIRQLSAMKGDVDKAPFRSVIDDYYLTNPIARASAVMAECSALAEGRGAMTAAE